MKNSEKLKKVYFDWLFKEYTYSDLDNSIVKIGTPFLDNDFDSIIMYVKFMKNGTLTLSDDGWTINNLESNGISFSGHSKRLNKILDDTVSSLGIERGQDNELFVNTSVDRFPIVKQRLLQAIMKVNDLVFLNNDNTKTIFFEEISEFLKKNDILFSERPSYSGKKGVTVQFDFSIPVKNGEERLIRTISKGNNLNNAKILTMDTRIIQDSKPAKFYALVDDENNGFTKKEETKVILEENSKNNIILLPYSKLKENPEQLANYN